MLCLALDTTGPACSAAIVSGDNVIAQSCEIIKRGHAEFLGPQVQSLFKQAGLTPKDIERYAVCTGPGSFTGLRVALAFAKGMALPGNVDVVGISALQIWAAMADPDASRTVLSSADVRRGEHFSQIFINGIAQGAPYLHAGIEASDIATKCGNAYGDGYLDPAVLARLGTAANPQDCPPAPLYHRPPDAKLPGGTDPFAVPNRAAPA